jgi:hypothetical protein
MRILPGARRTGSTRPACSGCPAQLRRSPRVRTGLDRVGHHPGRALDDASPDRSRTGQGRPAGAWASQGVPHRPQASDLPKHRDAHAVPGHHRGVRGPTTVRRQRQWSRPRSPRVARWVEAEGCGPRSNRWPAQIHAAMPSVDEHRTTSPVGEQPPWDSVAVAEEWQGRCP